MRVNETNSRECNREKEDTPVKLARRLVGDVVNTLDGTAARKVLLEHLVVHVEGKVSEVNAER